MTESQRQLKQLINSLSSSILFHSVRHKDTHAIVSPFNPSQVITIFPCEPKAKVKPLSGDIHSARGFKVLYPTGAVAHSVPKPQHAQCMCACFLS